MRRLFKIFLLMILLTTGFSTILLRGSENILVQLRLYEGFQKKEKISAVVVSSYYLKKLEKEQILSDMQIENEKNSLMKIYNLEAVENISIIDMELKKGGENTQEIAPGGRRLVVKLSMFSKENNRFKVDVREKEKKVSLLETEVIIPPRKTAVLGCEDAAKRIFFFSFSRNMEKPAAVESGRVATVSYPRLIKKVMPTYPEKAMAEGVEGDVLIRALINETGDVTQVKVETRLHPLLDKAALHAVRQWKYKPWMINGVPSPTEVSIKITFKLQEHPEKK